MVAHKFRIFHCCSRIPYNYCALIFAYPNPLHLRVSTGCRQEMDQRHREATHMKFPESQHGAPFKPAFGLSGEEAFWKTIPIQSHPPHAETSHLWGTRQIVDKHGKVSRVRAYNASCINLHCQVLSQRWCPEKNRNKPLRFTLRAIPWRYYRPFLLR